MQSGFRLNKTTGYNSILGQVNTFHSVTGARILITHNIWHIWHYSETQGELSRVKEYQKWRQSLSHATYCIRLFPKTDSTTRFTSHQIESNYTWKLAQSIHATHETSMKCRTKLITVACRGGGGRAAKHRWPHAINNMSWPWASPDLCTNTDYSTHTRQPKYSTHRTQ